MGAVATPASSSSRGSSSIARAIRIFPAGAFSLGTRDSCGLPGLIGDKQVSYDLAVELEICDTTCDAGCGSSDCDVVSPLQFSCKANRGSDPSIPSSGDPYLFTLRSLVIVKSEQIVCGDPRPTCIAVPGPRQRTVEPGLVVDLQVYQIAVDMVQGAPKTGDGALDLEACGCAP